MIMSLTQATHLNSVMMSSKVIGGNATYEAVELTIYVSYKRDHILTQICDDSYIANGGVIGNQFTIDCDIGCSNPISISAIVKCTAYSTLNNWSMGNISNKILSLL